MALWVFGCSAESPAQSPPQSDAKGIVHIRKGGTPETPRIVDGGGQTVLGLDLRFGDGNSPPPSNLIVRNYLVRSETDARAGVWLAGRRQENIIIENIDVQGFQIGIWSMGTTNLTIRDCDVSKCQMGISIHAFGGLVENCNVHELVHRGMGDSDYMRFAGENITFRGNRLWGADVAALSALGSHVDGWQVFTHDKIPRRNIIFEDNIVMDFHQAIIAQDRNPAPSELVGDWIIRNNIFAHGHSWSLLFENTNGVQIENNLFYDINPKGMGVRFGSRITSLKYNIMMDMKSGIWVDGRSTVRDASNNIDSNVSRERRGSELTLGDPQIVEGPRGTFRLAPGSPLQNTDHGPTMLRGIASATAPPEMNVTRTTRSTRTPSGTNDDPNRQDHAASAGTRERTGDGSGDHKARAASTDDRRQGGKFLRPREKALKNIRDAQESLRASIKRAQEARDTENSETSQASLEAALAEAEKALESLDRAEKIIGGGH